MIIREEPTLTLPVIVWLPVNPKVVPSKVKLPLSSSSPPVPAITTRLSVRSSTLKVFAWPPALISNNPAVVVTPATLKLSKFVWPSTSISPLISAPVATTVPVTVTPVLVVFIFSFP